MEKKVQEREKYFSEAEDEALINSKQGKQSIYQKKFKQTKQNYEMNYT